MKKLLLLIIVLSINYNSQAQDKKTEIVIDWQKLDKSIKEETILNPVQFGSFHTFRIEGINKFLYEVTLEGKKIELETPIPTELQSLFRLNSKELDETATNEADESVDEVSKVEEKINKFITYKSDNYNKIIDLKGNKKNDNNGNSFIIEEQISAVKEKIKLLNKFEADVNSYILKIKEFGNEILKLKIIRVELIILAQKDISAKEMKKLVNKINKPNKISTLHNELSDSFNGIKKDYKKILNELSKSEKEILNGHFKKLEESFKSLDEVKLISLYSEVNFLYTELKNENNFKVLSPPTQADSDIVNYEVTITPSQTNTLGPNRNPITFDFDVPVKGGLKVDFSVGPVLSFGDGAKDEKFYLENSETDDISILRQRNNNNVLNPSIGALMHFYQRSGKTASFGGLFGVGAGFQNIDDVNLSLYTGVTLVLGKSKKIMLNTGISFLSVKRLKEDEFEIGNEYNTTNFDLNSVTEQVFKSSFFLSLTYNLTNRIEN